LGHVELDRFGQFGSVRGVIRCTVTLDPREGGALSNSRR
jgi:hypothetical protein